MNNELRCPRDLALKLGAVEPMNAAEHRHLRDLGHLLIRDEHGMPLLWPSQMSKIASAIEITKRST